MREVEAQPIRRDQRALLLDMRAQHLAQRSMQQVRGRVVGHDGLAALARRPWRQVCRPRRISPFSSLPMCEYAVPRFCVSATTNLRADIAQLAGIAHLAAGLRIERSAVEEDLALLARLQRLDRLSALEQRHHLADVRDAFIAQELRRALDLDARAHVHAELAGSLGLLALLLHGRFVAGAGRCPARARARCRS